MQEFDYIVIGSGFGGSVSAMRLSQKGYKVAVIEAGKRWDTQDFPKTNWLLNKFLWFPELFCYGIQRIHMLKDFMSLSGAGVGGGSLVYANVLLVPLQPFFENEIVRKIGGRDTMLPFYELAKKMMGVTTNPYQSKVDEAMKETAKGFGREDTFKKTEVGVFFGEPDKSYADPYFSGDGPERIGCNFCGGCITGCRYNSKNTLDKNYLYFAEKLGAVIIPEAKVVKILPLSPDGAEGYEIITKRTTNLFGLPRTTYKTKGLVISAGVAGTLALLFRMKEKGHLANLSDEIGNYVRTNSEVILGVIAKDAKEDLSKGIAITSGVYPDDETHIEPVRYAKGSDIMVALATILTDGANSENDMPRVLKFIANAVKNPIGLVRTIIPIGLAKRTIILLVMQPKDNHISILNKRRMISFFRKSLTSESRDGNKIPSYIPIANEFARKYAKIINGVPMNTINEVLFDMPTIAHILGGCVMAESPQSGVIDLQNRVFGYQNMLVCDGSVIPTNPGVNPSLSITAFTERAMSFIKPKHGQTHHFKFEADWGVKSIIAQQV